MKVQITLPAPHEGEVYINGALQTQLVTLEIRPVFYEGSAKQAIAYVKIGRDKRTMVTVDKSGKVHAQSQRPIKLEEDEDAGSTATDRDAAESLSERASRTGGKQPPEHPRLEASGESAGSGS